MSFEPATLAEARRFSIAPMMDWTDRHCRYLHRQLTARALLFTEMVTSAAVVFGDREHLIGFSSSEHPVAVQLGGSDPMQLAEAARICADFGYDEINLNVGCPSDRVQSGRFGACLMAEPNLVATCVAAMKAAVDLPVTVKCRIGIDDQDIEESLDRFATGVVSAGADALYVHARKAWLQGLSPKQNRDVPPLDYDRVHRLAAELAPFPVYINGGIETVAQALTRLEGTSGVMMGRGAYNNPMQLAEVDAVFFGSTELAPTLDEIIAKMLAYADIEMAKGTRLNSITRHMIGLANQRPGARRFRQILTVDACKPGAESEVMLRAMQALEVAEESMQERLTA